MYSVALVWSLGAVQHQPMTQGIRCRVKGDLAVAGKGAVGLRGFGYPRLHSSDATGVSWTVGQLPKVLHGVTPGGDSVRVTCHLARAPRHFWPGYCSRCNLPWLQTHSVSTKLAYHLYTWGLA